MSPGLIINERIKTIRERKGLKASDLARITGLNQSGISQIEAGHKRSPRLDTIQKIARALDVSVDYLSGAYEYEGPLEKALASEALNLFLREARFSDEMTRALRAVAETETAPQSVKDWEKLVANSYTLQSHSRGIDL